jgi:ribosomal protein S18 acetylase RimI-like enzyme
MAEPLLVRNARPKEAGALARIQVDSYRRAYAGISPRDDFDQFSYTDQERDWGQLLTSGTQNVILVANSRETGIAGYALGRAEASLGAPYDSELVSLHVRRSLHRRGIGRTLTYSLASELAARGCKALMLWVLEANRARCFYERLGAIQLEGRKLTVHAYEVANGWPDIRAIAALATRGDQ